jgi:diguanylate cyclase (GGDEF)-like protein
MGLLSWNLEEGNVNCTELEATIRLDLTHPMPVLSVSDGVEALLGFKAEDLLSSAVDLRKCFHAQDFQAVEALFDAQDSPLSGACYLRVRNAAGRIQPVWVNFSKSANPEGIPVLELHLQHAHSLNHWQDVWTALSDTPDLLNLLDDFVYCKDRSHIITWANRKFLRSFPELEKLADGVLGLTEYDLFSELYADASYHAEDELFAGLRVADEMRETAFGESQQYRAAFRQIPIRNALGVVIGILCISPDLTAQRRAEEALRVTEESLRGDIDRYKDAARQLELLAHYDALTGLPNRILLADRIQQSMARSHRSDKWMALAYIDLDGFKDVNDKHGREAGDELLKALAIRMQSVLRRGDTIARLGGDEFVAVLHDLVNESASVPTLARLLNVVSQPILIGSDLIEVSASIGVTYFPQAEDLDADQLMRQADHAMYRAKLLGRNRFHIFDSQQDREVKSHQETLERIRKALAANEFMMYYQPKVNMTQGKVVGVEALIRWQHPERGLLPAGAFLPAIENHPLAEALGAWVIDSVLTQMELWLDVGLQIAVSINMSARQLRQHDFLEHLAKHLAAHPRVDPSLVELEIQATSLPQDSDRLLELQNGCRALGVTFALHNFGAGSATFNYLKTSAASIFKIDQGFVRDILDDLKERSILEGILGLAAAFSRQSLAEGVESGEHGLAVLRMGCELAQGFGIAYPMSATELPVWIAQWRPDPRWADIATEKRRVHPLVQAESEHLAWIAGLEAFFKGEIQSLPQLGRHQCKLGNWLDAETLAGRGSLPEFQAIVALHWRIHALATGALKLKAQNRATDALSHIAEMSSLLTKMFVHLKVLKPL